MELEEFHEKYKHIKVKFQSYYKYSFTFIPAMGDHNDTMDWVSFGECSDDIYTADIEADKEYSIVVFEWSYAKVKIDGEWKILSFDW